MLYIFFCAEEKYNWVILQTEQNQIDKGFLELYLDKARLQISISLCTIEAHWPWRVQFSLKIPLQYFLQRAIAINSPIGCEDNIEYIEEIKGQLMIFWAGNAGSPHENKV